MMEEKKPFSVVDNDGNCYSQHGTMDKAQDSLFDLALMFSSVIFSITEKLNWDEGGRDFPKC